MKGSREINPLEVHRKGVSLKLIGRIRVVINSMFVYYFVDPDLSLR